MPHLHWIIVHCPGRYLRYHYSFQSRLKMILTHRLICWSVLCVPYRLFELVLRSTVNNSLCLPCRPRCDIWLLDTGLWGLVCDIRVRWQWHRCSRLLRVIRIHSIFVQIVLFVESIQDEMLKCMVLAQAKQVSFDMLTFDSSDLPSLSIGINVGTNAEGLHLFSSSAFCQSATRKCNEYKVFVWTSPLK